jgi:hypothetical protein
VKELDSVVLTDDLPEHGLRAGDVGTVVLVHGAEEAYEVEFTTLQGETLAVVTLQPGRARIAARGEIAHARPISV